MKLNILAFGIAKDILGQRTITLEVPASLNVGTLLDHLRQEYPDFKQLASLRVAVNQDYAEADHPLQETDEVVLIPPVSGG